MKTKLFTLLTSLSVLVITACDIDSNALLGNNPHFDEDQVRVRTWEVCNDKVLKSNSSDDNEILKDVLKDFSIPKDSAYEITIATTARFWPISLAGITVEKMDDYSGAKTKSQKLTCETVVRGERGINAVYRCQAPKEEKNNSYSKYRVKTLELKEERPFPRNIEYEPKFLHPKCETDSYYANRNDYRLWTNEIEIPYIYSQQ